MANPDSVQPGDPDWLGLAFAERDAGVAEDLTMGESNPRINEYMKSAGGSQTDEVPWCSAFVNFCVEKSTGLQGTNNLAARSWLKWTNGKELHTATRGCIVVLKDDPRGPEAGHVGFFVEEAGSMLRLLGGNQSNKVTISSFAADRLLGFVVPMGVGLSMADVQNVLKAISNLDQKVDDLYRRENHGEANVPTTDDFSRKGLRKDHETLQKSIDDLAKQVNELKTQVGAHFHP
jgi:uncharacterized protein (TIGR02594 family)